MKYFLSFLFLFNFHPYAVLTQNISQKFITGDKFPDLILTGIFNDTIKTSDLRGKKILFTFNRYVSCPLCNFRTHELLEHYDTLKQNGLIIISVYESTKASLSEYTSKEQVPFIMIADPKEILYKRFKVQKSWWKSFTGLFRDYKRKHSGGKRLFKIKYERDGSINRIGADFLIDENGYIYNAYYGKFVGDHISVDEIVKWVLKK